MENLLMEQEGKAGAAVRKLELAVFSLLAEEGGKPRHSDRKKQTKKKKNRRANCSFFCCCHG